MNSITYEKLMRSSDTNRFDGYQEDNYYLFMEDQMRCLCSWQL